jgi:Transposase DDE domain group 1
MCGASTHKLPLSGAELGPTAPGRGEGGVASRRAVPACRLHRHQPPSTGQEGGRLLQRARTAEQWIKEGKNAVKWTRLSCTTFRANAVRLQLHALAYNLANFLRTLALPTAIADWSLTSLREKVVKIGAKVVAHGRYLVRWPRSPCPGSCSEASSSGLRGYAQRWWRDADLGSISTCPRPRAEVRPLPVQCPPADGTCDLARCGVRLPTRIGPPGARNRLPASAPRELWRRCRKAAPLPSGECRLRWQGR